MLAVRPSFRVGNGLASVTRIPLTAPSRQVTVTVEAAVPKKKTSKMKSRSRATRWCNEVKPYVTRALYLGLLSQRAKSKDTAAPSTTELAEKTPPKP